MTERHSEVDAVVERYAKRNSDGLYGVLRPEVILSTQEWQAVMLTMFRTVCGYRSSDLCDLKLVDVGSGYGGHLLDFLRFGFSPHNITGIELLADRIAQARSRVPSALKIYEGDATSAPLAPASQDIVFQSVVFSSLLSDEFQQSLADRIWSWLRPGGGVMWYDFVYDNPRNPDVRGVPISRVRQLFPQARIHWRRVTLAPPISRRVCSVYPGAYHLFNWIPLLRTHVVCWISKRK